MPSEKQKPHREPLILRCFVAYSSNNCVTILKVGQVDFSCSTKQNAKTRGQIEINGNKLEISTYNKKSDLPGKTINEDTSLLLLAEDSSLTSYYHAVLVDNIPEIVTAAFKLLDS